MKPLFKYMGGKQNLLAKYESNNFFPEKKFKRFVDLFCGGCAVSIAVAERFPDAKILLNDQNAELIQLYGHIRNDLVEFCEIYEPLYLRVIEAEPADRKAIYLEYRKEYAEFSGPTNTVRMSALLLTMLKNNFNGLWRCSKRYSGRYFTAPGHLNTRLKPPFFGNLFAFHQFLQRCELRCGSYQTVKTRATDWVYADPPYRGCRDGGTYGVDFSDEQSTEVCLFLRKTGALAALSNLEARDGFWQEQLPEFNTTLFDYIHRCGIGGSGPLVSEALIKNY